MRKWLAVAALSMFWWTQAPAQAQLGEGERAPNFEGKEFINSAKCDLKSLRGRIILYEVFRTW
jgi:hypothetical protein